MSVARGSGSQQVGVAERKKRQRAEREQRIVEAARAIAEDEGWSAVTVRRLAEKIEYSQPVLYSHFENRDAIVAAVAIDGFRELTKAIRKAERASIDRREAPGSVAATYLAFARKRPALYEAMFTLPTILRFAEAEAAPEMKAAFAAFTAVIPSSNGDIELATETFWAALHGLAELERTGRIRRNARADRIALLVNALLGD